MREKKNENDNRERTKGGIVLSVDRMEMEGKSENTAKTSQGCGREGRPLLPLLQTTSPPSHLPRIPHHLMRCKSSVSNPRIEYKSEFSNLV